MVKYSAESENASLTEKASLGAFVTQREPLTLEQAFDLFPHCRTKEKHTTRTLPNWNLFTGTMSLLRP